RYLAAPLHERADHCWRSVIDCHTVLFDDLEVPVLVGSIRRALVENFGDTVGQRPVDAIGVFGDPADIGGAPEYVGIRLGIEDVMVGVRRLGEESCTGVHDPLGLAGGSRCVEQKQWMLGIKSFGVVLC